MGLHTPACAGHQHGGEDEGNHGALDCRDHPVLAFQSPQAPVQASRQQRIDQDFGEQDRRRPDDKQRGQRQAQGEQDHGQRNRALLGLPDMGLASFTEVLDQVRRICFAVDVPVIADIDAK